jgi:opacity protein-like surface antigen
MKGMPIRFRFHLIPRLLLASCLVVTLPSLAHAQGYIAPFLGVNFGGDAGCQTLSDCEDKSYNLGVAVGTANVLFGFEEEFAYAKHFFGDDPLQSTSVLTAMSNFVVGPHIGMVRPYGLIGLGIIKTRVELTLSDIVDSDTSLGWNVGGGLEISGAHIGIRGDVRYFHGFQNLDLPIVSPAELKLDFGRAAAGVVLRF